MKKLAFTLAEVLITMTIIGIVAAMTIPNLLADVNQRKYNAASGNFQRKLGEALKIMSAQNTLKGHKTTLSFVNELGRNFKILKVCTTVTDCFPEEIKRSSGTIVDTTKLTDSASLGRKYETETVGVQFADGIRAIIAYNPDYKAQSNGDIVHFVKSDKTVKMNTNVVSMIFDVSEDDNNKIGEDIFSINTTLGGSGLCEHTKIGDYCIEALDVSEPIDCKSGTSSETKYCHAYWGDAFIDGDYWSGSVKTCKDVEMRLITLEEATEVCNTVKNEGGFPRGNGYYFTATHTCASGYCNLPVAIEFINCSTTAGGKAPANKKLPALCVAD